VRAKCVADRVLDAQRDEVRLFTGALIADVYTQRALTLNHAGRSSLRGVKYPDRCWYFDSLPRSHHKMRLATRLWKFAAWPKLNAPAKCTPPSTAVTRMRRAP
jgi:hypothetical protein